MNLSRVSDVSYLIHRSHI